jgi:metal-responsive CopG/Arc/MetJ family transcriptional regulator
MKTIQLVGFKCPQDIVREIDNAASDELLSRSSWIRRALIARLREEVKKPTARQSKKELA